jgi:hypothetical protein
MARGGDRLGTVLDMKASKHIDEALRSASRLFSDLSAGDPSKADLADFTDRARKLRGLLRRAARKVEKLERNLKST